MNMHCRIFLAMLFGLWSAANAFAQDKLDIRHGPYLQNLGETEVTIVWVANKPSVGWVELAPDDGTNFYAQERPKFYDTVNGLKRRDTVHTVRLTGLRPGTRYRYRVYAREVLSFDGFQLHYGNLAATDVYGEQPPVFTTNDRNRKELSFVMLNDIHNRAEDVPLLFGKVEGKQDLVLFNGDMVTFFKSQEVVFSGFMDSAVVAFAKETPVYYARGNHETRGAVAEHFQRYFSPNMPHPYFMFRNGPVCFVVLDSGEDKPDSDIEYNSLADYDRYRDEQAEWLRGALRSAEYTEAAFKVIVCHIPPIADEEGMWHGQREVLEKFVPLINEAGADLMLCGHMHKYMYAPPSDNIRFPILVNAHDRILSGKADAGELQIRIFDKSGRETAKHTFRRR